MYPAHRFVCVTEEGETIPLAAAFIDIASDWPKRRIWIGRAMSSDGKDLIDPGKRISIWLLPRARAMGVFIRVRVTIAGEWEWSPLNVDSDRDGIAMQWAMGEAFALEVDRLTVPEVPENVLFCVSE